MADPHLVLAPLVEPPLPSVSLSAPVSAVPPGLLIGVAILLIVGAAALYWLWRRRAPRRALRRIGRLPDPVLAAHALARLVRRRSVMPPLAWQQALDRLRFGPPAAEHPATVARLCAEAQTFLRAA